MLINLKNRVKFSFERYLMNNELWLVSYNRRRAVQSHAVCPVGPMGGLGFEFRFCRLGKTAASPEAYGIHVGRWRFHQNSRAEHELQTYVV